MRSWLSCWGLRWSGAGSHGEEVPWRYRDLGAPFLWQRPLDLSVLPRGLGGAHLSGCGDGFAALFLGTFPVTLVSDLSRRDPASAEKDPEPHRAPLGPSVPRSPARTSWRAAVRNSAWSASTVAPGCTAPSRKSPPNSAAERPPATTLATPSVTATATSASSSSNCMAKGTRRAQPPPGGASCSLPTWCYAPDAGMQLRPRPGASKVSLHREAQLSSRARRLLAGSVPGLKQS